MDITGVVKSHQANSPRRRMFILGNKFFVLRKSEVAKVAPNRSALIGKLNHFDDFAFL